MANALDCRSSYRGFESLRLRHLLPWLNWLQHLTLNQGILGSSPSGGTKLLT